MKGALSWPRKADVVQGVARRRQERPEGGGGTSITTTPVALDKKLAEAAYVAFFARTAMPRWAW